MKPLLLGNDLGMNIILKKEISIQIIGVKGLKNIIFLKNYNNITFNQALKTANSSISMSFIFTKTI